MNIFEKRRAAKSYYEGYERLNNDLKEYYLESIRRI